MDTIEGCRGCTTLVCEFECYLHCHLILLIIVCTAFKYFVMGSYDLQVESLRKVNFVLADKPNYASNLMLRFPFHQLAEVLPLNVEVIR